MTANKIAWFTGLSGAGKSTIAQKTADLLRDYQCSVNVLDGDIVRTMAHRHLGFSPEDIRENNRLIAEKCLALAQDYDFTLVAIISPYQDSRKAARHFLGKSFIEIYVRASLKEVMKRDPKGIYEQSRLGNLTGLIGVAPEVPYQPPDSPDLTLDTEANGPEECANLLANFLLKSKL